MAQDSQDGISYLQALKRAAKAEVTTAAPEQRPDATAADASAAYHTRGGTERRRSPRYKCEGGTEMIQEDCTGRTWATFTDISLHGCYVEAMSTFPVGTGLQLKLEAQGFRVRCKGTVRVVYPSLGMGIAFTEMSEEDRAQLKQLVQSPSGGPLYFEAQSCRGRAHASGVGRRTGVSSRKAMHSMTPFHSLSCQ
jgi:PilZ domain